MTFSADVKKKTLEARLTKLKTNPMVNTNLIKKVERQLRKLG